MPTPKRFAFVIADLYGGGAEKSLLYTADGLRQRGHVVKVSMPVKLVGTWNQAASNR